METRERKAMTVPLSESSFLTVEPSEEGSYPARFIGIHFLGSQKNFFFGKDDGKGNINKKQFTDSIRFELELPTELAVHIEGEEPTSKTCYKDYNRVVSKGSDLFKMLKTLNSTVFTTPELAAAYDLTKLLGKPCTVTYEKVAKKEGGFFAKVKSITPVTKGLDVPAQIRPSLSLNAFDYTEEELEDANSLSSLTVWAIKQSNEYKTAHSDAQPTVEDTGVNPVSSASNVEEGWGA